MNRLRNFIYEKNDLIVALLVVLITASILWWKIDGIMEYPKKLVPRSRVFLYLKTSLSSDSETGFTSCSLILSSLFSSINFTDLSFLHPYSATIYRFLYFRFHSRAAQ